MGEMDFKCLRQRSNGLKIAVFYMYVFSTEAYYGHIDTFLFFIFHTLICKIHTLICKFYTLICKM
jgi:hypothetical protein